MKLRRLPADFQVEELATVADDSGPFALYELRKQSVGTPEAIAAIVDRWQTARKRISYGGLKDRHAITAQYLTIHQGPKRNLQQKSFELTYIGQTSSPFTAANIDGNRFTLVLRDMSSAEIEQAQSAVHDLQRTGLPNYFDDQRFGSLGLSGEWIGKAWCRGDYERALWLALADPHPHDSSSEKQQKAILRKLWGQWPECKAALARSHRRSIITYLSDKVQAGKMADARGAFARISVDLRGLYLSAWQSVLWNRLLTAMIRQIATGSQPAALQLIPFRLKSGEALFPSHAAESGVQQTSLDTLRNLELPLPSARIDSPEGIIGELLDQVLEDEEIALRELRVKYPRDSFFSRGTRRAVIQPEDFTYRVEPDELYPRQMCMTLAFSLPRGSYATILVKRLTEEEFSGEDAGATASHGE